MERTNQAKSELEARCQRAERERDMYRLLARRWQSRLQAVLDEQRNGLSASSNAAGAVTGATAAALQELQQEGILNDSSDDDSEEDEEDEEDDVSMMEQDEDEEADEHSDGLGHAAAAHVHAPGNGLHVPDDEAYFSCMEHAAPGQAQPIHGNTSSSTMDEEMSDVEEGDLGAAQVTGTDNLEIGSESKVRAVSIASDDL